MCDGVVGGGLPAGAAGAWRRFPDWNNDNGQTQRREVRERKHLLTAFGTGTTRTGGQGGALSRYRWLRWSRATTLVDGGSWPGDETALVSCQHPGLVCAGLLS
ncbi:unnamed protein product, partial [Ectocarpus sp. 12 AP-2014]